jgi:hypothetical protein
MDYAKNVTSPILVKTDVRLVIVFAYNKSFLNEPAII